MDALVWHGHMAASGTGLQACIHDIKSRVRSLPLPEPGSVPVYPSLSSTYSEELVWVQVHFRELLLWFGDVKCKRPKAYCKSNSRVWLSTKTYQQEAEISVPAPPALCWLLQHRMISSPLCHTHAYQNNLNTAVKHHNIPVAINLNMRKVHMKSVSLGGAEVAPRWQHVTASVLRLKSNML